MQIDTQRILADLLDVDTQCIVADLLNILLSTALCSQLLNVEIVCCVMVDLKNVFFRTKIMLHSVDVVMHGATHFSPQLGSLPLRLEDFTALHLGSRFERVFGVTSEFTGVKRPDIFDFEHVVVFVKVTQLETKRSHHADEQLVLHHRHGAIRHHGIAHIGENAKFLFGGK